MTRFPRFGGLFLGLGALAALAIGAGCSNNDGDGDNGGNGGGNGGGGTNPIPSSWAGVWQISGDVTICDSDSVLESVNEMDTFCAGEHLSFDIDDSLGISLTCPGVWTDTSVNITCTETFNVQGTSCTATITTTATRSGDTIMGSNRVDIVCAGSAPDFCIEQDFTGTRLSNSQAGCTGPPGAWLPEIDSAALLGPGNR